MKLKKSFSPGTLRAEQHGARQRTCQRSPVPAVTTVTMWVPLPQRRAGGCWRRAGPWLAACLAAPGSSTACRCSAHRCVTHLTLDKGKPTWSATSSKRKPIILALAKPHHHQSLSSNNLCCLCSLAQLEKSAGSWVFFSKDKLTPITVWKSRLHS